tara:strand:- start:2563 stop:2754 length:192 start_codon:yes stop_codon:yes gene_type:complete
MNQELLDTIYDLIDVITDLQDGKKSKKNLDAYETIVDQACCTALDAAQKIFWEQLNESMTITA